VASVAICPCVQSGEASWRSQEPWVRAAMEVGQRSLVGAGLCLRRGRSPEAGTTASVHVVDRAQRFRCGAGRSKTIGGQGIRGVVSHRVCIAGAGTCPQHLVTLTSCWC